MDYGLYLHIPFCTHRCAYCDFSTFDGLEALIPAYVAALCAEAVSVADAGIRLGAERPPEVDTIFFGGGTPSLLPLQDIQRILTTVKDHFQVHPGAEITLEANPGTVDLAFLEGLQEIGVHRLSVGVQSADPSILRLLDRTHDFAQAEHAVRQARSAGFENLSLDLILGVMDQTLDSWRDTLQRALAMRPEHLSLYILSVEEGTPMAARVREGALPAPDPDLAADMYDLACDTLAESGYHHYEISNWARGSATDSAQEGRLAFACRHNLRYWRNQAYLGLGAGAHGCAVGFRFSNVRSPQAYIRRLASTAPTMFPFSAAVVERQPLDRHTEMRETMLMGLRLLQEGVQADAFLARFGTDPRAAFPGVLERLEADGLVQTDAGRFRLTRRGWLLANQVLVEFV